MAKEEDFESENPNAEASTDVENTVHEGVVESDTAEGENQAEIQGLLEDARAKADEHWNQLLRANAELENAKRRARQDVENAHKYALEKFVSELLPIKDSLEMGLNAASQSETEAVAALKEGVELTLKMFAGALEKFSVVELDPVGEIFDPALHQAMTMQESAEHEPNRVMAVMQKGYQLNERLIRPAMVVVSKAAATPENTEPGGQIDEKA